MGLDGFVYNTVNNITANYPVFEDGSEPSVSSPVSVTTTATVSLLVPARAILLKIVATVGVRLGTLPDLSSYFLVPANTVLSLPVATVHKVYIRADSSDGVCYFFFEVL